MEVVYELLLWLHAMVPCVVDAVGDGGCSSTVEPVGSYDDGSCSRLTSVVLPMSKEE